jgi:tetraacyldisaccharide 4'-kinase
MVMWVARFFHEKGFRVACIRRGYRARGQSLNDESLEFLQRLPGVIQIQDADRVKAAELAVKRHGAEIIVLDDGFQHRRIRRDLDIVLIDATVPYGYDKLLPRGLLREPISAIRRADVIVLSRVDQVSEQQRIAIHQRMRANNPHASWAETMARPSAWQSTGGEKIEIGKLAIPRVYGFCGIGNPGGFQRTLQKLAAEGSFEFCGFQSFPDHHAFSQKDIRQLVSRAREQDCEAMVCTHKDLVRIDPAQLNGLPLFALLIDIEFLKGQLELESQLSNTVIERRKSS